MSSNNKKKSLNFESTLSEIEKIIESLEEGIVVIKNNQISFSNQIFDKIFKGNRSNL